MNIYESKTGVDEYIKMCEGYDSSFIESIVVNNIPDGSTLLEIGMGPGNDFLWLSSHYRVTGSDCSKEFLKRARARFPDGDIIPLDAKDLKTDRQFDIIFSNKVYQHFTIDELEDIIVRQNNLLNPDGHIIHTFWVGGYEFKHEDIIFYYHDEKALVNLIESRFNIIKTVKYREFEDNDSIVIIGRKKS